MVEAPDNVGETRGLLWNSGRCASDCPGEINNQSVRKRTGTGSAAGEGWHIGKSAEETRRYSGTPNGTRTRVSAVKGRRPRPLDDGRAERSAYISFALSGNPESRLKVQIFYFLLRRRQRQFQSRSGPTSMWTDLVWQ